MENMEITSSLLNFYKDKKVLITGHTGFKGTWLTKILLDAGSQVIGYSLKPPTEPNLFSLAGFEPKIKTGNLINIEGDVRDLSDLLNTFREYQPEIVFHLAAQPIVRESYKNPVYTYETNVIGTVNVLESIRKSLSVKSAVIITTDKVYKNNEWVWGYRENEPLDGFDPYSNSKSCADLAVHSYINSYPELPAISVARAGNVIGGGDFAADRIIPDCVRTLERAYNQKSANAEIKVRNPYSTRPYQHVLEPLAAYMMIGKQQWDNKGCSDCYNVGPDDCDCLNTGDLVTLFCNKWNQFQVNDNFIDLQWISHTDDNAPHEANFLKLDSTRIKKKIGYKPVWHIDECMDKTVSFTRTYLFDKELIPKEMKDEIQEYFLTTEQRIEN